MKQIRLTKGIWQYDPSSPLGKAGGFGTVFAGTSEQYGAVAIKQLHISASDAAHRELRIADELSHRSLDHVIPMLDGGLDAESDFYYVVMARAERSLQDEIKQIGVFTEKGAVSVLRDIAAGLSELRDMVHRDLKPANVLLHDGKWKLADFGIARFVEESTSLQTLKGFLSAQYAAPEQWVDERATPATDIYALGCIAYALVIGRPPFQGPKREDYREQHLHVEPPSLETKGSQIRALVASMMRKVPQGRPSIDRVIQLLEGISAEKTKAMQGLGFSELAQAGAGAAEASLRADAKRVATEALERKRFELSNYAFTILGEISETFYKRIQNVVVNAERIDDRSQKELLHIRFGDAALQIQKLRQGRAIPQNAFPNSHWDVIVGATIYVAQFGERKYKWGANLWYTNMGQGEDYRWWEVMYMWHPALTSHPSHTNEPFAVDELNDADAAAAMGTNRIAFAAKPRPVDDEDADSFYDRWAKRFAQAYSGRLERPRYLPLD